MGVCSIASFERSIEPPNGQSLDITLPLDCDGPGRGCRCCPPTARRVRGHTVGTRGVSRRLTGRAYSSNQGAEHGYTRVRGLNAQLATVSGPQVAPVIAAARLRRGAAASAHGAVPAGP